MKLTVPYSKITDVIRQKAGKTVTISSVSPETIKVGYDLAVNLPIIGEITKHIDVCATISRISGSDIYLILSDGIKQLANIALFFTNISSIVEKSSGGFVLHLSGIESLKPVLDNVALQKVIFSDCEMELVFDVTI